jgi:nascent polypeptide-associated complex subunit beta
VCFLLCVLDDKKLGSVLKKMSMTSINAVEEVNIFKNDGSVIHITTPKSMSGVVYFSFL